jgi:PHD/YefM family antitoxin component YafN of YafNO toxin-antitoxin module
MVTVAADIVEKNFAEWRDKALQEPFVVTQDGQESVVVVSAETFRRLMAAEAQKAALADLEAIVAEGGEQNEIPTSYLWNSTEAVVDDARRGV